MYNISAIESNSANDLLHKPHKHAHWCSCVSKESALLILIFWYEWSLSPIPSNGRKGKSSVIVVMNSGWMQIASEHWVSPTMQYSTMTTSKIFKFVFTSKSNHGQKIKILIWTRLNLIKLLIFYLLLLLSIQKQKDVLLGREGSYKQNCTETKQLIWKCILFLTLTNYPILFKIHLLSMKWKMIDNCQIFLKM